MSNRALFAMLLFQAPLSFASASEPVGASIPCISDRDCPPGWICDIEFIACPENPQASECVRKVCVPDPQAKSPKPAPPRASKKGAGITCDPNKSR